MNVPNIPRATRRGPPRLRPAPRPARPPGPCRRPPSRRRSGRGGPGAGPVEAVAFPPDAIREVCDRVVGRYPTRMAALLPVLHVAQRHYGGWISPEVEAGVAA